MRYLLFVLLVMMAAAMVGCVPLPIIAVGYGVEASISYDVLKNKPKMDPDLARFLHRDPNTYKKIQQ